MTHDWDRAVPITFTRRADLYFGRDRYTVDDLPSLTVIDDRFLAQALAFDRPLVRREGDLIRLRFDNGWCAYRIVDRDPWRGKILCERLESCPMNPIMRARRRWLWERHVRRRIRRWPRVTTPGATAWVPATIGSLADQPWLEEQLRGRLAFLVRRDEPGQPPPPLRDLRDLLNGRPG